MEKSPEAVRVPKAVYQDKTCLMFSVGPVQACCTLQAGCHAAALQLCVKLAWDGRASFADQAPATPLSSVQQSGLSKPAAQRKTLCNPNTSVPCCHAAASERARNGQPQPGNKRAVH